MSLDYKALGVRSGIEIHQQLEGSKLFARSPSIISKEKPDFVVNRNLRVSASETGRVDKAAQHEKSKHKSFDYYSYYKNISLVELDEEPPQSLNEKSLVAVLQVCKLLNCKIVDKVHVMRKIVIDGSNTSGFQRTMLVGMDGFLDVDGKRVGIESVCLEEESCQAIKRTKDLDTYNLSRLGIPLIEIATAPDLNSPEEVAAAAKRIGMILRSTGACRRGIGSIRQDVNLSIKGGKRIEIKGFQDIRSIKLVMDHEIGRQKKLLDKGDKFESHVRKAEPDGTSSFLRPMPGAARMYPETDVPSFVPDTTVELPKLLEEKAADLEKLGLPRDLASVITKKDLPLLSLIDSFKHVPPLFLAEVLVSFPKELKKRFDVFVEDIVPLAEEALDRLNRKKINSEAVIDIVALKAQGKPVNWKQYEPLDEKEVEETIKIIVQNNPNAPVGALMGMAMKELRGKAPGKLVMQLIQRFKK